MSRFILVGLFLGLLGVPAGQEAEPEGISAAPAKPGRTELERRFREQLSNVVLEGRWYLFDKEGLGDARTEKYTIGGVTKVAGDTWLINARIEYGEKDVSIPVPVTVKWAGDTPVISVTNAGLPGLGTYTARVLVYDGAYAGTWSGGDHGGVLSGRIVKEKAGS